MVAADKLPEIGDWVIMATTMHENTRIIAIETSSGMGSVALARGEQLLGERFFSSQLRHGGELVPMMDRLIQEQSWQPSDIEQIYVSVGPGSFTGLRIAITAVKALVFAQPGVRIVAVASTDVLVQNAHLAAREHGLPLKYVGVVIDAKRNQIYTALYEKLDGERGKFPTCPGEDDLVPGFRTIIKPVVMLPEQLTARDYRPLYLLGEGIKLHREKLAGEDVIFLAQRYAQPQAAQVHRCGWLRARSGMFTGVDELVPLYLRRPEAIERWEMLHGQEG